MPETHRIEYKRELTPDLDLEKEVIAFLNTPEGGLIFIGIDKDGRRVGVADMDGDMLKIKDRIKNSEFFEGYSIPRNKELMRIFKDLEMVEHLGSGIPRITQFFSADCFHFTENFIRSSFPSIEPVHAEDDVPDPVTPQVTPQVEQLLSAFTGEHTRQELQEKLGLADREYFRKVYLLPALEAGYIVPTLPDKPNSRLQKYRLTEKGKRWKGAAGHDT